MCVCDCVCVTVCVCACMCVCVCAIETTVFQITVSCLHMHSKIVLGLIIFFLRFFLILMNIFFLPGTWISVTRPYDSLKYLWKPCSFDCMLHTAK